MCECVCVCVLYDQANIVPFLLCEKCSSASAVWCIVLSPFLLEANDVLLWLRQVGNHGRFNFRPLVPCSKFMMQY